MTRHLSEADVIDVAEGGAGDWRAHLDGCAACVTMVSEARAMLILAADTPAPDPSPLYWQALQRKIAAGVDAPRPARVRWWLVPATLAAAAAIAVAVLPPPPGPVAPVTVAALPAWSALPAEDEDSLQVLDGAIAQADDLPAAVCGDVAECVATMSDEESAALLALMRREMAPGDRS
jgi:hypothetical protein